MPLLFLHRVLRILLLVQDWRKRSEAGRENTDNISLHGSDKYSKNWHVGSGKKKLDALGDSLKLFPELAILCLLELRMNFELVCLSGAAGVGFTPHVITVDEGEVLHCF